MHLLSEEEIRSAIREAHALESADLAFRALGSGGATVPLPLTLAIHDHEGELHVKAAYLHGSRFFVVKAATGFYQNATHGLPSGSGLMILFDASTGFPLALLQDNGYLTELRTAAAGVLAAQHLAPRTFERIAILGAGAQARYQLRAFAGVFHWLKTSVWSRTRATAQRLCDAMRDDLSSDLVVAESAEAAVRGADIVITVTPSTSPILRGEWLAPHATVIAVGSDDPAKRELDDAVFERADRLVVDSLTQSARLGELHHAIGAGLANVEDCTELGEIVLGKSMGRMGNELIVCDLTGLGVQDAAIAEMAYRKLAMGEATMNTV
jgi:ornithine cyclodeaminase